jgi:hypothetical protein
MIEIILIIFLAQKIGSLAESKGLKGGSWKWRLVGFWLAAEFVGAFVGIIIFGTDNFLSVELVAVAFAVSSYFILKRHLEKMPDSLDDDINNIGS